MVIVLVGNKTDLTDKRIVSLEDGEARATELDILFMETSAKAGFNIKVLAAAAAACNRPPPPPPPLAPHAAVLPADTRHLKAAPCSPLQPLFRKIASALPGAEGPDGAAPAAAGSAPPGAVILPRRPPLLRRPLRNNGARPPLLRRPLAPLFCRAGPTLMAQRGVAPMRFFFLPRRRSSCDPGQPVCRESEHRPR